MTHLDSRLPFSPLTDAALLQATLDAAHLWGGAPERRERFQVLLDLREALAIRLHVDPFVHVSRTDLIDVGVTY
ncbi:hypothetical protein F9L07_19515 [Pimelobacter simplex]|uniref:Uncharacterized protein n=1 Tax=Nocardioides simplex TaxID=2045 RepID=A0A7J5DVB1_NOCSI|nr:hypothetical protein [Pimelobacter simplex]KAB2809231.1 hypothetical protein F9L07_19515 [Pimelobacter simplex]